MTLQEFLVKWNGRHCEVAGSANAKNQCVDLANAYLRDVLKLPIVEWTNAIDFPSKLTKSHDFIPNTPSALPKYGDLIIWGKGVGHIAIFLSGNLSSFTSFDQNFPTGSPCHAQGHTYAGVLGWLRSKIEISDMPNYLESLLREDLGIDIKKSEGDVRSRVGEIKNAVAKYEEQEKRIKELEKDVSGSAAEAAEFEKRLQLSEKSRDRFEKEVKEVREMIVTRDKEISALTEEIKTLKETLDPDTKVVITREEYDKLTKRKPLDGHTTRELIKEAVRRQLVKSHAWFKKWFTLKEGD